MDVVDVELAFDVVDVDILEVLVVDVEVFDVVDVGMLLEEVLLTTVVDFVVVLGWIGWVNPHSSAVTSWVSSRSRSTSHQRFPVIDRQIVGSDGFTETCALGIRFDVETESRTGAVHVDHSRRRFGKYVGDQLYRTGATGHLGYSIAW